jgi:hypothetical protein
MINPLPATPYQADEVEVDCPYKDEETIRRMAEMQLKVRHAIAKSSVCAMLISLFFQ